jgi:predicted thioesterase
MHQIDKMATKYLYQMVMKNAKIFHSKGLPKCTKTGGLSLKVSHLATLLHAQQSRRALKIEKRVCQKL